MKKKSQLDTYVSRIDKILFDKNLTKVQVARALGIDYSTLHRWINNPNKAPALIEQLNNDKDIRSAKRGKLAVFTVEDLVDELTRRGWEVNLSRKNEK